MGVNRSSDEKAIENEHKWKNISFSKVIRITSKATNQATPLVRVFTENKETCEKALSEGITLGFQKFRCEQPRENPVEVQQCFKCYQYNHIAKDCQNELACSKCGDKHLRKECQSTTTECTNCGEDNPSSYKGCKVRTEQMQAKRDAKETKIAKLPPPRAEVNEQIRELKEGCLKLERLGENDTNGQRKGDKNPRLHKNEPT